MKIYNKPLNLTITLLVLAFVGGFCSVGKFALPLMVYHALINLQHSLPILPSGYAAQFGQLLIVMQLVSTTFNINFYPIQTSCLFICLDTAQAFAGVIVSRLGNWFNLIVFFLNGFRKKYLSIRSAIISYP